MKSIVVTGSSSGIGQAITQACLKAGYRVFGSVRRDEDAERAARQFGSNFVPLVFDVRDADAVERAAELVKDKVSSEGLFGLVNNAGVASVAPLLHESLDTLRDILETNVVSQVRVVQAFAPLLMQSSPRPGRIVNMTSISGKLPFPFLGAYTASKHAFEAVSAVLRLELQLHGVDVITVGPGSVETPIWDRGGTKQFGAFAHTPYARALSRFKEELEKARPRFLPPERIAETVLVALTAAKPKTRYAPVPDSFANWTLPRLLPSRLLDRVIGKQLGLLPAAK